MTHRITQLRSQLRQLLALYMCRHGLGNPMRIQVVRPGMRAV